MTAVIIQILTSDGNEPHRLDGQGFEVTAHPVLWNGRYQLARERTASSMSSSPGNEASSSEAA